MTNHQLVKKARALDAKISKLNNKLCTLGYGYMTYSELRRVAFESKTIQLLISALDSRHELRLEAEKRYGPGLITIDQLIWKVAS